MPGSLDDSIQFLRNVGPARADDFAKLGVLTVRDLLFTFPRDMSDRSDVHRIGDLREGALSTVVGAPMMVEEKTPRRRNGGKRALTSIITAEITDASGEILEAVWFNQPWLKDKLPGRQVMLHGKAVRAGDRWRMEHPLHEILPDVREAEEAGSLNFGRIVPIYPCTGKLSQGVWRKAMDFAIATRADQLADALPPEILAEKNFPTLAEAVTAMHFPENREARRRARRRLAWEESFFLQLAVLAARRHALHDLPGRAFAIGPELDNRIRRLYPFKLTPAQDKAIREITRDMKSPLPMQRLLQGDVGSGKTAVAAYALLAAAANKAQSCVMAPTSLLAQQHYDTFHAFLANSPNARVRIGLLTGGMPAAEKRVALERLANGTLDIVCATHSAIGDNVAFHDLGLVIIDEQHKFGVRQRVELARKGVRPDTLVMTATPIPRSLALSVYGDLDLSIIDALPPGRKPVQTLWYSRGKPAPAWELVRKELSRGRQAFVVCPLVEESEESDLKSAGEMLGELAAGELKGYRLEILHGRMKRREQQEVMDRFRRRRIDALISTIVIEVGVDIPNATVMAVDHAERFGLAQLHQLRGRVGRGLEQGYFVMLSDAKDGEAGERLSALMASPDGFAIAEADLRIRGPGDFIGTRQHGMPPLKLVDLVRDIDIIADARQTAAAILERDAELTGREHLHLHRELVRLYGKRWDRIAGGG